MQSGRWTEGTVMSGFPGLARAVVLVVAAAVSISGCSRAEHDRLAEARAAFSEADHAGASLYAPELFEEAGSTLARAEEEWRIGRHASARDLAGESARLSRRAVREADANRDHAKGEAVAGLRRLEDAVERAREAVANMVRAATAPELAQARADLERLELMLSNVRKAIEHGLYLDAREMTEAAEGEAVSIEEGARLAVVLGGGGDSTF
jgi:hypothetical protein